MSPSNSTALQRVERASLPELPDDPRAFLAKLGGPTAIHVPGRDASRTRMVTTLLHGNEPSGLHALWSWLRGDVRPAVDTWLVIASVEAALAEPGGQRMRPGHRDLNRCFLGPFDDVDGLRARAILDLIDATDPEALVDVHNNTGHNPPYGVAVELSDDNLQLVALFAERVVHSHLELGALMEAVRARPSATIEAGRSGDPAADAVAEAGLKRFLEADRILEPGVRPELQILVMPMRVCLRPGVRVAVRPRAGPPDDQADLTLFADLDRHNFETVAPGTPLGIVRGDAWPIEVIDEQGRDRAADYFALDAGGLRTIAPIVPIMITTDPKIAAADCLFYVVRPASA